MTLERDALLRGVVTGMAVIVPLSVLLVVLDNVVDDLESSAWMLVPFVATLAAYLVAGFSAGRLASAAPLRHGAVAALVAFAIWLVVRTVLSSIQGDGADLGGKSILVNVLLAPAFGLLGGALSARDSRV